ncbi:HAD family hydrolase [Streptomonospora wellingtoniae]|uniref:HAD-IA family hydrolase n=1 Tax=Streptomonospora wellingtoniae TaxID=3075544 RepID=A0ABU2L1D9_9ACTN|nr:HAD-IA family hydrolase [Streptomonospora sp. DSM 45055]MDT0305197.1 HAD-IA family hydrolase [Streptomonospora sp. DSM 45055]
MEHARDAVIAPGEITGVAFDMDGVVTDTASVHAAAWKRTFDDFLRSHLSAEGERYVPFALREDYLAYVDGRSRLDGVRTFLASRGITLPEDGPDADPRALTVAALGDRKERYFLDYVGAYGVTAYPSTIALLESLRRAGIGTAVVSASRNCAAIVRAAGAARLFDVRVDGRDAERLRLPGKPDPALFLEAARRMATPPARTAVVEDSLAGVEAGARGGFGLVVGVDRVQQASQLYTRGAHVVVSDLGELTVAEKNEDEWTPGR